MAAHLVRLTPAGAEARSDETTGLGWLKRVALHWRWNRSKFDHARSLWPTTSRGAGQCFPTSMLSPQRTFRVDLSIGELDLNSDHSRSPLGDDYNGGWSRRRSRDTGLSPIAAVVAIGATFNYFCRSFAEPTGAGGRGIPSSTISISSDGFAFLARLSTDAHRPSTSWVGFRRDRRTLPVVEGALVYAVRDIPAVLRILPAAHQRRLTNV